jgi:hypothetical protein
MIMMRVPLPIMRVSLITASPCCARSKPQRRGAGRAGHLWRWCRFAQRRMDFAHRVDFAFRALSGSAMQPL